MSAARDLGPAGSARKLRTDLRRAREVAGLTQAEVAKRLGWSMSKLARIESGDVGISADDLRALGSALELGPAIVEELVRRAETARRRGWWHAYRTEIEPGYLKLLGVEAESDETSEYAGQFVPGVLQTAQYAEALTRSVVPWMEPERVVARVDLRMRRQSELYERRDPPAMQVLLDESALYRRVGGREVMAQQIGRLTEFSRRPYLSLRILPFESLLTWPESFYLLRNSITGVVVYSESHFGDVLIEDQRAVEQFEQLFRTVWSGSLNAERTAQLLHRAASGYAAGHDPRPWLWE